MRRFRRMFAREEIAYIHGPARLTLCVQTKMPMTNCQCYTLAHADPSFIHQHVVDAFTAQRMKEPSPSR